MKSEEIIALAIAGIALWMIGTTRSRAATVASPAALAASNAARGYFTFTDPYSGAPLVTRYPDQISSQTFIDP